MPLKKSLGNMYNWVTHMHTHLGGECPHECSYCYVGRNKWGRAERYKGELRLMEWELKEDYGNGKIIFIEHMNDMFAKKVRKEWIEKIFVHCNRYPNQYVFQTKNPERAYEFYKYFPPQSLIGTTIETNRNNISKFSQAPAPVWRYEGIERFAKNGFDTFVTIEPIMDFDVDELVEWISDIRPKFVNIGADSKKSNLPEPSSIKITQLIIGLNENGIVIKKKANLERILK